MWPFMLVLLMTPDLKSDHDAYKSARAHLDEFIAQDTL